MMNYRRLSKRYLSGNRKDITVTEKSGDMTMTAAVPAGGDVADYIALLKPRVMSLVVFTGFAGLYLAPGTIHPVIAAVAVLCIAVGAGASGAINMWYDRDIDAVMERTAQRPVPTGRIEPGAALAFGVALSVWSVMVMGLAVGWAAAALLAFTIWLLCLRLHNVAETPHTAEYRHWWGGWCLPADGRLGRVTGEISLAVPCPVRDYLHVDAAAFLGFGAVPPW